MGCVNKVTNAILKVDETKKAEVNLKRQVVKIGVNAAKRIALMLIKSAIEFTEYECKEIKNY
ncbi:Uncharacterised protein [Acholeplasma hippikon]|uniref:HMA domain-containing protein n=2 Tax=Acholeplasma hippikon TaxID=264636 RepID=A0A449BHZ8_9MOLU|nr:Uncharacterised protein [Acholeplasma hippikon]